MNQRANESQISSKKVLKALIVFIVICDLYLVSFFVFITPCQNMNIAPYQELISPPGSVLPPYPSTTFICFSQNNILNEIGYCVYWPVHRCLENMGYWHFIKNLDEYESM
jgi:hypothetical protein